MVNTSWLSQNEGFLLLKNSIQQNPRAYRVASCDPARKRQSHLSFFFILFWSFSFCLFFFLCLCNSYLLFFHCIFFCIVSFFFRFFHLQYFHVMHECICVSFHTCVWLSRFGFTMWMTAHWFSRSIGSKITSTAGVHQMRLLHRHSLYHCLWYQLMTFHTENLPYSSF